MSDNKADDGHFTFEYTESGGYQHAIWWYHLIPKQTPSLILLILVAAIYLISLYLIHIKQELKDTSPKTIS